MLLIPSSGYPAIRSVDTLKLKRAVQTFHEPRFAMKRGYYATFVLHDEDMASRHFDVNGKRMCAPKSRMEAAARPFPVSLTGAHAAILPAAHVVQAGAHDACMLDEGESDQHYSEHYKAHKEWWLSYNQQVACGSIVPE